MAPTTDGGTPPGNPPDYKQLDERELVKEIEKRIDAGRQFSLESTELDDLRAALVADDQAVANEAKVAAQPNPPADPAGDGEVEDTSGRPPLEQVAAERAENRNPRVINSDVQEEN